MPISRAQESDLSRQLEAKGIYVYTHTVNDLETFNEVKEKGVKGIYTDYLM